MSERPILTKEEYKRAEQREGYTHPVIDMIERNIVRLNALEAGYPDGSYSVAAPYIAFEYRFLVDELADSFPYTLSPEDLIAIWSRVIEVFPHGYQRYAMSAMLTGVYAIGDMDTEKWKEILYPYRSIDEWPEELKTDISGLQHIQGRLRQDVWASMEELNRYVYGTPESGLMLARNLVMRMREGDKSAEQEYNELLEREATLSTPLLDEIHENFGNGYGALMAQIETVLIASGRQQ